MAVIKSTKENPYRQAIVNLKNVSVLMAIARHRPEKSTCRKLQPFWTKFWGLGFSTVLKNIRMVYFGKFPICPVKYRFSNFSVKGPSNGLIFRVGGFIDRLNNLIDMDNSEFIVLSHESPIFVFCRF